MIGSAEKHELLEQASAMCAEKGARLLYLTVFGSALYGTGIAGKSDTDVRGVFLPGPESLILGTAPHSIHHTTGGGDSRNTGEDLDIDLWSVQHWLLKLLPAGDTGAEDVLFSPSNADCELFRSPLLDAVFSDPMRYLDTRNIEACVAYSLGQAKKYGIKGSRLGALRRVYAAICDELKEPYSSSGCRLLLSDCVQRLLDACPDERFCRMDALRDEPMLFLCGKWHSPSITAEEFKRRLGDELNKYGSRAEEAEKNGGIDWKAISHAVRAIRQSREILTTGGLVFPLACAEELIRIKTGSCGWEEAEDMILRELDELRAVCEASPYASPADMDAARAAVLACYEL